MYIKTGQVSLEHTGEFTDGVFFYSFFIPVKTRPLTCDKACKAFYCILNLHCTSVVEISKQNTPLNTDSLLVLKSSVKKIPYERHSFKCNMGTVRKEAALEHHMG